MQVLLIAGNRAFDAEDQTTIEACNSKIVRVAFDRTNQAITIASLAAPEYVIKRKEHVATIYHRVDVTLTIAELRMLLAHYEFNSQGE